MRKYQRGFDIVVMVVIITVIGVAGLGLYKYQQSLLSDIKEKSEKIGKLSADLTTEQNKVADLVTKNTQLNKDISLFQTASKEKEAIRIQQQQEITRLNERLAKLKNKSPQPLQDADVSQMTDKEIVNSDARIDYLWSSYTTIKEGDSLNLKIDKAIPPSNGVSEYEQIPTIQGEKYEIS